MLKYLIVGFTALTLGTTILMAAAHDDYDDRRPHAEYIFSHPMPDNFQWSEHHGGTAYKDTVVREAHEGIRKLLSQGGFKPHWDFFKQTLCGVKENEQGEISQVVLIHLQNPIRSHAFDFSERNYKCIPMGWKFVNEVYTYLVPKDAVLTEELKSKPIQDTLIRLAAIITYDATVHFSTLCDNAQQAQRGKQVLLELQKSLN